jgi:hypothetical protein
VNGKSNVVLIDTQALEEVRARHRRLDEGERGLSKVPDGPHEETGEPVTRRVIHACAPQNVAS